MGNINQLDRSTGMEFNWMKINVLPNALCSRTHIYKEHRISYHQKRHK
jgi:hypothetical protein